MATAAVVPASAAAHEHPHLLHRWSVASDDWRGAGGTGTASIPSYIFLGGVVQLVGAISEWLLGNTFSFVLFAYLSGFFMTLGGTFIPAFNAMQLYASDGSFAEGLMSPGFSASFAFFVLAVFLVTVVMTVCAIRTNMVLVIGLIDLDVAFGVMTGSFFAAAKGSMGLSKSLQVGAGATIFVLVIIAFYLFIALMVEPVDLPFQVAVGDLSWVPSGTEKAKKKKAAGHEV